MKQKLQGKSFDEIFQLLERVKKGESTQVAQELGVDLEGAAQGEDAALASEYVRMALDDTLRGLSGLKDTKSIKGVIKNFEMMSKDDAGRAKLESVGVKNSGQYLDMFKSMGSNMDKVMKGDALKGKDGHDTTLAIDLKRQLIAAGLDEHSVGKAVDFMSSSPELAKGLLYSISKGDTAAIGSAIKNLSEGKAAEDDDATASIKAFTKAIEALTGVLTKSK